VIRIFLLASLLLLALAGCRQSQQAATSQADVQIELSVDPAPPQTGDSTLLITVTKPDGSPAAVARIEVRGDMNHAGMQPVFSGVDLPEDDVYHVPFNWTMGGDWFLDVTALLADGSSATQRFEVTVES
jgi:hypothetical protein